MTDDTPRRALIAEDEPLMAERLRRLLAEAWPALEIACVAPSGDAALEHLARSSVDVLFLDIRMPGRSGLDVASLAPPGPQVVFTTAYDEYAVAAFEAGAIDYLLKPVTVDRLRRTIARVRQRLAVASALPADGFDRLVAALAPALRSPAPYLTWLRASVGATIRLVKVADAAYFVADTKYTRVVTDGGEALVRLSLKELLAGLDPATFWQVHRGTIVNVEAIDRVSRDGPDRLLVHLRGRDESLAVSRAFMHRFRRD